MIQSIILFFIIIWGLGFTLTNYVIGKSDNFLERNLMRLGFGLGFFPILAVTLHLLHIPLHWLIFLVLSLAGPGIALFKSKFKFPKFEFKITKSSIYIFVVLILAIILFCVYLKGANTYPYLEDDDPWSHAESTKYISIEKTAYQPADYNFKYIDPYTPSYDILMGVLHQTNDSVLWTLKFFNALIISLGIIFFYFFAKEFSENKKKALAATFIITVLPCFMSHFIWAQTLALVLFFPAFYCLEKIKENKKWAILGAIIIASILVTQPSTAAIFVAMVGIYWLSKTTSSYFDEKKIFSEQNNLIIISLVIGIGASLIYWGPMLMRYGLKLTLKGIGVLPKMFSEGSKVDTSGGLIYGIKDFMIAPLTSKMDQPIGIGIFVFLILIFTIVLLVINFKRLKRSPYLLTAFLWFVFTFLGTESNALPFKLFPHRFWVFLAIPVAFLTAEAIIAISKSFKNPALKYPILLIIFIGILWTSAYPKYVVETSTWPAGVSWTSQEEIQGYLWLKTLPPNTEVFTYSTNDRQIIGLDKYSCSWCNNTIEFRKNILEKNIDELHSFLKKEQYKYLVISGMSYKYLGNKFGENKTKETINNLLNNIQDSIKFTVAYQTKGALILNVN